MKTKNFLFLIMILFACSGNHLYAQKKAPATKKQMVQVKSTYCDDDISKMKNSMEQLANQSCKTVKKTIECTDRKSGMKVHVILVVQPTKDHCGQTVTVDGVPEPASRGAAANFKVEVLQELCSRGGVTLTAYIPGYDALDRRISYQYQWLANGEPISNERSVSCVNDKNISLRVTNQASGQAVKKQIQLQGAVSNKNYKMYGYKKTSCYGNCPTFEVNIYKDGQATWIGKANVDREGQWEAQIDEGTMKKLKDQVFTHGYFDMGNKYPVEGEIADASRTITYVRIGDMEKSIDNVVGAPEKLIAFEEFLKKVIDNAKWSQIKDGGQKVKDSQDAKMKKKKTKGY